MSLADECVARILQLCEDIRNGVPDPTTTPLGESHLLQKTTIQLKGLDPNALKNDRIPLAGKVAWAAARNGRRVIFSTISPQLLEDVTIKMGSLPLEFETVDESLFGAPHNISVVGASK